MSPVVAILVALCAQAPTAGGASVEPFDARTLARVLQHSPLPKPPADPTNRVADDPRAARLGQALFYDTRLSADGRIACATCHEPTRAFTDGRAVAVGIGTGTRNVPTIRNVVHQRWFFWDGRADSAWSQALHPLEDPLEMGTDRRAILRVIGSDASMRSEFEALFGALPPLERIERNERNERGERSGLDEHDARAADVAVDRAFAGVGKALAAYERSLTGGDSEFDRFVAALRAGDAPGIARYPLAARRGLALFVGRADCRACHAGPLFSDGEFHDVGVPARAGTAGAAAARDPGRRAGIELLRADPFRSSGAYSDAPDGERAREVEDLVTGPERHAQMRTPSLRNVARTAPYMHAGQFATLRDVVTFYSTRAGAAPTGHHVESILRPLDLAPGEIDDLIAFLGTLDDAEPPSELLRAPAADRMEPRSR